MIQVVIQLESRLRGKKLLLISVTSVNVPGFCFQVAYKRFKFCDRGGSFAERSLIEEF